ncbi:D-alanine--D-alanine ligase A [Candidatus Amesbacteria bacterium RIFOXYB1_FULL_47_13]|nr:MAG: D-alanine--D-alanine ligase A [Candidatus Amesbacteria bacterium RIFOXYB1_FULL_47_13]HBC72211.1 D-alanine--D-alanine ligase A [Candidatus Amesbacteria bacterium]
MTKMRVGLVFGGRSGEHEVSVRSAKSIYEALDKNKYEVELLGVDKTGQWHRMDQKWLPKGAEMKALPSGEKGLAVQEEKVDIFFPIIHGTFGEDGTLQGLFELLDVAYVGAGVLGSAVGMDKDVQKRLLIQAGIPVANYVSLSLSTSSGNPKIPFKFPVFVKPANMGSSVGISKIEKEIEVEKAIKLAFQYDTKVIVEEAVEGREIEISVLGNEEPTASLPGEVIPRGHEFYDYEAKYIDENGAELVIPARLSAEQIKICQELAVKTFKVLECSCMARVDMFLTPEGKFVVNEINTLPGFTNISMYPKLWEATGIKYADLLDKLIRLALEKKKEKDKLKRSYS